MPTDERLDQLCYDLGEGAVSYANNYRCAADIFGAYVFLAAKEDYEMAARLLARAKELVQTVELPERKTSDLHS